MMPGGVSFSSIVTPCPERSGASMSGEDAAVLAHRPCDRLVRALPPRDLRAHVRHDERRHDLLDRRRERTGIARKPDDLREVLKDLMLRIRTDDRHRLPL